MTNSPETGALKWPHHLLDVPIGTFNTGVLIFSSITVILAWASLVLERARLKGRYMDALLGARGQVRWQNYPVEYKLNSPAQLAQHCAAFREVDSVSLHRRGAEDSSLPALLRGPNRVLDDVLAAVGAPGSNFVFRLLR